MNDQTFIRYFNNFNKENTYSIHVNLNNVFD